MKSFKQFIYNIDFIGQIPQLRVLNNNRYHSLFSIIVSIGLILFAIGFSISSIIQYKNQDPSICYYKTIDKNKKDFLISDSLLMVQLIRHNNIINDLHISTLYFDDKNVINFGIEACELGKNINFKYKEFYQSILNRFGGDPKDYYCINFNKTNIYLSQEFNHNENFDSYLSILITFNKSYINIDNNDNNYLFSLNIITEDDYINHKDGNGIIPSYHYEYIFVKNENYYIQSNYEFNYLDYETDNGYFFENIEKNNGLSFSQITNKEGKLNDDNGGGIIEIHLTLNSLYYDYFKRSYKKLQSLLADITSVINLLIILSTYINNFLLNKIMSKDIITQIIVKNEKESKKLPEILKKSNTSNEFFSAIEKNKFENNINKNTINEKSYINKTVENKQSNMNNINDLSITSSDYIKISDFKEQMKINTLKHLNFFDSIKNIFCIRDKKHKLSKELTNIFKEDICIVQILKRIYKLERIYSIMPKDIFENVKIYKNKRMETIYKYINSDKEI